jgi:hypothetical protein
MDFLPMLFIFFGLASAYYMFYDVFGSTDKVDNRPPPKSQAERRERREERERELKAEYEEKKALKLKARKEKDKLYQDKKENEKREKEKLAENERMAKEEKKRIAKEKKLKFFNWFKPKKTTHHYGNTTIISDRRNIKEKPIPPLFGSANTEPNPLDDKMEKLLKEIRDL